jgi:predicted ATPase with chaperone activity
MFAAEDTMVEMEAETGSLTGPRYSPRSIAQLDVESIVLENLALKILYLCGSVSLLALADKMRLDFEVANELFYKLRGEILCHATGMTANIPQVALTAQGRSQAAELLSQNQYAGPTPVSLASYIEITRSQSVRNVEVHPADVERAFAHLVVDDRKLEKLGTALNSGNAIFLYGPPGTGKTSIAECLPRAFSEDLVWIPYAIEVDGQIITVYDPAVHTYMPQNEPCDHDERWVLCRRPAILTGGELTVEMLDLELNPKSNYYVGPLQLKANNGVLIIDDFGRQRIAPSELLNRWVVPLDRRIDFLTMAGGKKIEIPFEMLVVFATNMNPYDLADPAFLRRIQTKIEFGAPTEDEFREIFRRSAAEHRVVYEPGVPDELIEFIQNTLNQDLRSCYPRDIIRQACWAARYQGVKPHLDSPTLKRAVDAYFLPAV